MRLTIVAIILGLLALPGWAEPLPKGAKPLSARQITGLYAGNSAKWETSMAYFAPDKTITGVYGKPASDTCTGTWKVTKNRICMTNTPVNIKSGKRDTRTYTDCWTHYSDNGRVLTSYYNDYEDGKGPNEDYYEGELGSLTKGDVVTRTFMRYRK